MISCDVNGVEKRNEEKNMKEKKNSLWGLERRERLWITIQVQSDIWGNDDRECNGDIGFRINYVFYLERKEKNTNGDENILLIMKIVNWNVFMMIYVNIISHTSLYGNGMMRKLK